MSILAVVVLIVVVCLIVWVIQSWNPAPPMRNIVYALTLLVLVLLLCALFGAFPGVSFGGPARFR